MKICASGHRPNKLFKTDYYSLENRIKLKDFAVSIISNFDPQITEIISGMAAGWDWAIAEAALQLNIPFDAYIPFAGQESRWPEDTQVQYHELLKRAEQVKNVCGNGYAAWKMQRRNEEMSNDAELVLALWDGSFGGTYNCVQYAKSINKHVMNVWHKWLKYNE